MGVKRSRRDSLSSSEDPSSPFSREQSVDVKLVHLDTESVLSEQPAIMKCLLPPHEPLTFASYEEYDVHYQKMHMNRCSECQKNFPDEHILYLHISENHDPFNAAKRERGEQTEATVERKRAKKNYACLVPSCDRLCSTAPKRRMHCIDKHQFPRNYDFFIINDGIDCRNSMLRSTRQRRSSTFNVITSSPARQRGESFASVADGDMDVVYDEADDHGKRTEAVDHQQHHEMRPSCIKLRGRGGFSHPRRAGQVRGVEDQGVSDSMNPGAADSVDNLTSSMSALQFVPQSVRMARGRGRGRGS